MSKDVISEGDEGIQLIIRTPRAKAAPNGSVRQPIHVFYGGADRFSVETPRKLGRIALASIKAYSPSFVDFASAFRLEGYERLPSFPKAIRELEAELRSSPDAVKHENFPAWLAWSVFQKTKAKLKIEPVEDLRIDFEDGYGFRPEVEEDAHAVDAAAALGDAYNRKKITTFSGFRIKSLSRETYGRGIKTLELFLATFLERTSGRLPTGFVITLPKVTSSKQVKDICRRIGEFEKKYKLSKRSIGLELMIETPEAIMDRKGRIMIPELINAARGRCRSIHFGAFDYTAALGIAGHHQRIDHPACELARSLMQFAVAGTEVGLSDSVTTEIPIPIHRHEGLSDVERAENRRAVHSAWLSHFRNVERSMAAGFYRSWDLHPNQLVARYAAVYSFFLREKDIQALRLRGFLEAATKANLTGNTFDDSASAQGIMNFFRRGRDSGAFTSDEVEQDLGLSTGELDLSFAELAKTTFQE